MDEKRFKAEAIGAILHQAVEHGLGVDKAIALALEAVGDRTWSAVEFDQFASKVYAAIPARA